MTNLFATNTLIYFSLYDKAAQTYLTPFLAPTVDVAKRSIKTSCERNSDSEINKYSSNFVLMSVGTFNETSGEVKGVKPSGYGTVKEILTEIVFDN